MAKTRAGQVEMFACALTLLAQRSRTLVSCVLTAQLVVKNGRFEGFNLAAERGGSSIRQAFEFIPVAAPAQCALFEEGSFVPPPPDPHGLKLEGLLNRGQKHRSEDRRFERPSHTESGLIHNITIDLLQLRCFSATKHTYKNTTLLSPLCFVDSTASLLWSALPLPTLYHT